MSYPREITWRTYQAKYFVVSRWFDWYRWIILLRSDVQIIKWPLSVLIAISSLSNEATILSNKLNVMLKLSLLNQMDNWIHSGERAINGNSWILLPMRQEPNQYSADKRRCLLKREYSISSRSIQRTKYQSQNWVSLEIAVSLDRKHLWRSWTSF